MNLTRATSILAVAAAGAISATPSHAALTAGLAYSAFNIAGNPDPSGYSFIPTGPVPFVSTAWSNVTNTQGAYISDGGGDGIQVGAASVWNRVGANALQEDGATNVTLLYRGWLYDSDGIFAFGENIDDNVQVRVDGNVVLLNDQGTQGAAWQSVTRSNSDLDHSGGTANGNTAWASLTPLQQAGNFGIGWHSIEIRLGEFGGTGGPHLSALGGANWNDTFGFGIAGIGNSPLPSPGTEYDALMYTAFDVANFGLAPDGGPALRYDNIDPTGGTNIIIPEPAGLALLLGSLSAGLMGRRRRA
jgi:hypothetical protein